MRKWMLGVFAFAAASAALAQEVRVHSYADLPQLGEIPAPRIVHATAPVALSLLPGVAAPAQDWDISLLRINLIAGEHHDVRGIDIGLAGNITDGEGWGLAAAGIFNRAERFNGLQIALVNYAKYGSGLQIGAVNITEQFKGLQLGLVNVIQDSKVPVLPVLNFWF